MMIKKQLKAIAEILNRNKFMDELGYYVYSSETLNDLMDFLKEENPKFDKSKFCEAVFN